MYLILLNKSILTTNPLTTSYFNSFDNYLGSVNDTTYKHFCITNPGRGIYTFVISGKFLLFKTCTHTLQ